MGIKNLDFELGDIKKLRFKENEFGAAILNMGTIGNFDNKEEIITELFRVARKVYIDFYEDSEESIKKRKKMYEEEKWSGVKIKGKTIVSDDGLESQQVSKDEIKSIVKKIGAILEIKKFGEFGIMTEFSKN